MQEYQVQRFRGGWAIVYPSDTATGRGRNKLTARSHGEALAEAARVWRAMKVGRGDTAHWFRHSAAVWMAEARVPMAEISQYLGHDNIRTTERIYARFSPDFLQGAAAALEW